MDFETQTASAPTDRSSETRARILDAALREFSALGMAGARMDQIAAAAGVNKALLYYHFDSKENLYAAALEMIAGRVRDQSMSVFLLKASPGERFLRSALNHFDRILTQGEFQSLMQQEMMRMHQGEASAMSIVCECARVSRSTTASRSPHLRQRAACTWGEGTDQWGRPWVRHRPLAEIG